MEKQKNAEEIVELSAEELDKLTGGIDLTKNVPDGSGDFWQVFAAGTLTPLNRRAE